MMKTETQESRADLQDESCLAVVAGHQADEWPDGLDMSKSFKAGLGSCEFRCANQITTWFSVPCANFQHPAAGSLVAMVDATIGLPGWLTEDEKNAGHVVLEVDHCLAPLWEVDDDGVGVVSKVEVPRTGNFWDFCRSQISQISKFLCRASSILFQYFFCHW